MNEMSFAWVIAMLSFLTRGRVLLFNIEENFVRMVLKMLFGLFGMIFVGGLFLGEIFLQFAVLVGVSGLDCLRGKTGSGFLKGT